MLKQRGKDAGVCADESRFCTVASREVLRSYDRHYVALLRLHEQNLAVVVGKIGALNHLVNERLEFERLVRSLVVENKVDAAHTFIFADKVEPPQKLLRNGERSLPNLRHAHLRQNPFQYVRHLHGIGKVSLKRRLFQRSKDLVDVGGALHFFSDFLAPAAERFALADREGLASRPRAT